MSDQISEKMARKLARQIGEYTCYEQADQLDAEARCMRAWRAAGLIKPSKLYEARKLLRKICDNNNPDDDYRRGFEDAAERFEAAITEILEERE